MILDIFSDFSYILPIIGVLVTLIVFWVRKGRTNSANKREPNNNNAQRNIGKQTEIKPNRNTVPIGEVRKVTIGRDPSNQFVLSDTTVSRFHLELIVNRNNSVEVIDKNSTNGTFVNGVQRTSYFLQRGDNLRAGNVSVDWQQFQNSGYSQNRNEYNNLPIQNGVETLAIAQTSFWLSLITFILGFIIGFIALGGGIGAIITGIMALKKYNKTPEFYTKSSKNYAIWAIVIGSLGVLRFVFAVFYLYYIYS